MRYRAGDYLRLSLVDESPRVYQNIGPAFDELTRLGDYDPTRPSIELYVSHDEVHCLFPVG